MLQCTRTHVERMANINSRRKILLLDTALPLKGETESLENCENVSSKPDQQIAETFAPISQSPATEKEDIEKWGPRTLLNQPTPRRRWSGYVVFKWKKGGEGEETLLRRPHPYLRERCSSSLDIWFMFPTFWVSAETVNLASVDGSNSSTAYISIYPWQLWTWTWQPPSNH